MTPFSSDRAMGAIVISACYSQMTTAVAMVAASENQSLSQKKARRTGL
jgi:hypothetical protein